jgi:hypothetical protein
MRNNALGKRKGNGRARKRELFGLKVLQAHVPQDNLAERSQAVAQGAIP